MVLSLFSGFGFHCNWWPISSSILARSFNSCSAALVLIVEPGRHPRIDPALVGTTLGLTPAESQVAVWLADGKSVRDIMATATDLTDGAIYWHLKQIYQKLPISRQVDGAVGAVDRRVRADFLGLSISQRVEALRSPFQWACAPFLTAYQHDSCLQW